MGCSKHSQKFVPVLREGVVCIPSLQATNFDGVDFSKLMSDFYSKVCLIQLIRYCC